MGRLGAESRRASERGGQEGRTARRRLALEEPERECRKQAPARPRWQEQPASRSLSVGHLQLQYDFGGILGWRAEDRKVSQPEPLPELCLPTARTPVLPGCARFAGSERLKVCRGYFLSLLSSSGHSRGVRGQKERAPHAGRAPRAFAKGRSDRPCRCGSCGRQPVASPSAWDWQCPRERVAVALSGLLTGRPAFGRARGHGGGVTARGAPGLQRPRCAVARALGREGRGAGRGGRDGLEGRRADGIPLLCLRVGWIRWGMPSRKCSAKP